MSKQHKRWRGCCLLCARWVRGDGKHLRMRFSELRRIGVKRRLNG